jgi:hypothetical protein
MASNVGKSVKQFVPAQSQQVGLAQSGGYQLGRETPVQQASPLAERPMNIMKPQEMRQGGSPRGAQEIKVVGMAPQAPLSRVAPRQVPPQAPQIAHASSPLAMLGSSDPGLGAGDEVHTIEVVGQGPDGREYVAPFDVVFPKGSKILGARERA